MSSQKGNVSRSRGQKHQNDTAYRNDKYGATIQVKKANSKIHEGICQHCKGVLEWKVKYSKYKSLTQAKKCIKCAQKTVKDAYHILCKPCSLQLGICCKCGKKGNIVIPINSQGDKKEEEEEEKEEDAVEKQKKGLGRGKKDVDDLDSDDVDDDNLSDPADDDDDDDDDEGEDLDSDSKPKKTPNKSDVLPDVSRVSFKD
ncbi:uncharacterized protein C9orf85 homolog [Cottoperca gobio]|uniref:Uncharacterized protein C9orf85 homolog n=1 Tax=Cottoperca gobio TaxID=56716 RepID=A0A6J2QC29_COTGO|nr:uncharacterized protein C9orf85 homolog [Cottoperca gobio]